MNNHDRSDRDVRQRRRRRGAYAAGLSAAVGVALAAAMIPAAPAFADPTDDVLVIGPGGEETILNEEIIGLFGGINDPSAGALDVQVTDSLLGLLPGGGHGTDATEVETLLVNDLYTPLIDALGGGERMLDVTAADAVPAKQIQTPDGILDKDISILFGEINDPSGGGLDVQVTDTLLGLLPGGVNGTDGIEVETLLANDVYTPAIDLLGTLLGGGGAAF